jgi:2-C-methyl-D-erythritol 2,4-cyclodiphosphate synthase
MKAIRTGFGYDLHRLAEGRKLVLGGVDIPFEKGLDGHSDADVLLHAITDALLGAAALGDIGAHFPDTDPAWKGADSRVLLRQTAALIREKGYLIGNVDSTVVAERPKLRPHIDRMREHIAADLGVDADAVSVKATTSERIGMIGREEGICAMAVCLLWKE